MSPSASNPYPNGSADHYAWKRWHRAYFAQPVAGQFYDLAAQLRGSVASMLQVSSELSPQASQHKLRMHILALEGLANLVQEAAERADGRLLAPGPSPD